MKAIFLDRDGTVNVEFGEGKISSSDMIVLLPNSLEALKVLAKLDYKIFLVTNQLGIARGNYTTERFHELNNLLLQQLEPTGISISKTYFCPHAPEDNCGCRKPKPGMLLQAAKEFDIELADSYMVGDRLTDIQAGKSAGTKTILVRTGQEPVETPEADYTAADLLEAARYIAAQS